MENLKPSISVFFPFLNDWGTIGSLVALSAGTLEKLTDDWEIVIINDGSKAPDREALGMVAKYMPRVRIVDHEKNSGYGGALRSGFKNCQKELVFYTDGDAQYDPRELALLYEAMKPDVGMVNGYKIKRNDPLHRVVMGRLYHHTVRFLFKLPIRDTDCDFRLIRKDVLEKIKLFESTGTICTELVKKIDQAGFKIVEVPVHHFWRTSGKSQFFNFKRLYRTGTNLLKLYKKLMIDKNFES